MLPGRRPIGWDPNGRSLTEVDSIDVDGKRRRVWAVAAVMLPDWLRLRRPACTLEAGAPPLAPEAYTEAGWMGDGIVVAAVRLGPRGPRAVREQHASDAAGRVRRRVASTLGNRLLQHLARCALELSCGLAWNVFFGCGEAFLPVSVSCDANCWGCVSIRPGRGGSTPAARARAVARVKDLVDVALEHLRTDPASTVTFGLGRNGDLELACERIERSILAIRSRSQAGMLNLDTQVLDPAWIARLCNAGLDAIRISLNSAVAGHFERWYGSGRGGFEELRGVLGVARGKGTHLSLSLLTQPGFSDRPSEVEALLRLIDEFGIERLQLRNLPADPDAYLALFPSPEAPAGMGALLRRLKRDAPNLWIGTLEAPRLGRERTAEPTAWRRPAARR